MATPTAVIAASDLSDMSERVATRAARVAGQIGVDGQLLHVIEANVLDAVRHWIGGADALEKLRGQAAAVLQAQSERVAAHTGKVLAPQVLEGNVLDSLLESTPEDALLVLGAKGQSALHDLMLGNTARHALYRRQGPVLVVKAEAGLDYQRIMVATDFSAHALRAVQRAKELFPDIQMEVVHVISNLLENRMSYTSVDEALIHEYQQKARSRAEQDMQQFINDTGIDTARVTTRVEAGDPGRVLPALVQKLGVDLIVTGKQGRTALGDRLLGSVSQHLLQESAVDVLVECQS
jgi:nucleotide-binding universal stress UspA family protein